MGNHVSKLKDYLHTYDYSYWVQLFFLKGLHHRRVFFHVCLQIDTESCEWGLSLRSVDLKWNP